MMQLREYQKDAVRLTRAALVEHGSALVCAPVGSGKTVIACEMVRLALLKGSRCVFLVHRQELVAQAHERLAAFGIDAGIIKAGYQEDRALPVQVACIPTLIRRELPPADLVIVDECHHSSSGSWTKIVNKYKLDGKAIVGLSATPCRLDGRPLGALFGTLVEPVSVQYLIDKGYLVLPTVWAPPIDLSGVRVSMGDYDLPELEKRVSTLTGDIVSHWQRCAQGRKTVAFAVNVKHSLIIRDAFRAAGVRAEHLDGKTPTDVRAWLLQQLRDGEIDVLSNVLCLTEGWDLPTLECVILARPTKSLALYLQMAGRVMRPPGPVVILDHAGNTLEHGFVQAPIAWDLNTKIAREVGRLDICDKCYITLPDGWAQARVMLIDCDLTAEWEDEPLPVADDVPFWRVSVGDAYIYKNQFGIRTQLDEPGDELDPKIIGIKGVTPYDSKRVQVGEKNSGGLELHGRRGEIFRSINICPSCHAARPGQIEPPDTRPNRSMPDFVDSELKEIKYDDPKMYTPHQREAAYIALVQTASDRKVKLGWARHAYKDMFGEWPKFYRLERQNYICRGHVWETTRFGTSCEICRVSQKKATLL